jgi:hypothetical protein
MAFVFEIIGQFLFESLAYGIGKAIAAVLLPHLRIEPLQKQKSMPPWAISGDWAVLHVVCEFTEPGTSSTPRSLSRPTRKTFRPLLAGSAAASGVENAVRFNLVAFRRFE